MNDVRGIDYRRCMALDVSLVFLPIWSQLKPYLKIDLCPRDGGSIEDPRIRIGFEDLPEALGRQATFISMPCVSCLTAMHPLRKRRGDYATRLYYACACPVAVRPECSKGRAAMLEYERFKGISIDERPAPQLSLF